MNSMLYLSKKALRSHKAGEIQRDLLFWMPTFAGMNGRCNQRVLPRSSFIIGYGCFFIQIVQQSQNLLI